MIKTKMPKLGDVLREMTAITEAARIHCIELNFTHEINQMNV